tara:strand:- start:1281 stop:1676 length:396 start_codon:yes stop_codon:yes gene_type:complete
MNNTTKYKYAFHSLRLCKTDDKGNLELHSNGQPKLFSYDSDTTCDLVCNTLHELNEAEDKEEYRNWVVECPIKNYLPLGIKPVDRKNLLSLLRKVEVDLTSIKHNCDNYDMDKDINWAMDSLTEAIEELEE